MKLMQIINEGVNDPSIFKAVFLAGGPGSGKSFVGQDLMGIPTGGYSGMDMTFSSIGLKVVSSDIEFKHFLKKNNIDPKTLGSIPDEEFKNITVGDNSLRSRSKRTTKTKTNLYLQGRLGIFFDGTGHNYGRIKNKKETLESIGYDTFMIFVNTELEIALQRNRERVHDRVLPDNLVKDMWSLSQNNKNKFKSLFGSNFIIIDNSKKINLEKGKRPFPKEAYSAVKKFINKPLKNPIALQWIRSQKGGDKWKQSKR